MSSPFNAYSFQTRKHQPSRTAKEVLLLVMIIIRIIMVAVVVFLVKQFLSNLFITLLSKCMTLKHIHYIYTLELVVSWELYPWCQLGFDCPVAVKNFRCRRKKNIIMGSVLKCLEEVCSEWQTMCFIITLCIKITAVARGEEAMNR